MTPERLAAIRTMVVDADPTVWLTGWHLSETTIDYSDDDELHGPTLDNLIIELLDEIDRLLPYWAEYQGDEQEDTP